MTKNEVEIEIEIDSLVFWFRYTDVYRDLVNNGPYLMRDTERTLCAAWHRVEDPIKECYALQNV